MAIEYILSLDQNIEDIQSLLIKMINEHDKVVWNKNFKNQDVLNINYLTKGFNVSVIENHKKAEYDKIKFYFITSIVFRLDKEYFDISLQKENLLVLVLNIINNIQGDVIFNFNGENLLLYRKNNNITINEHYELCKNSNKLKEILKSNYNIVNEAKDIDYFPLKIEAKSIRKDKIIYKTYQGKDYTEQEWKKFEEEEYRKYTEKRSGKKSSFLADEETEKQNFSIESGSLEDIKYFVMNPKQENVPVYEYPSAMVAPVSFLDNGTAIELLSFDKPSGWCEILSKDKKKGYIQSNYVKKND